MTQTLTTEQLEERAKLFRKKAAAENTSSRQSVAMLYAGVFEELIEARELLANREAQPVAFYGVTGNNCAYYNTRKGAIKDGCEDITPLYTAPPAPGVPEKIGIQEAKELFNYLMTEEELNATVSGYNACRAAMLEQPVSGGYKLPPHAYRELVNSLRDTAVKYSGTDQLRERLNTVLSQFIEPDHPHTRTTEPDRN